MLCVKAQAYWCTCLCQHLFSSQRGGLAEGTIFFIENGWQSNHCGLCDYILDFFFKWSRVECLIALVVQNLTTFIASRKIFTFMAKMIIRLVVCFEKTFLDMYIYFFQSLFELDVRVLWFDWLSLGDMPVSAVIYVAHSRWFLHPPPLPGTLWSVVILPSKVSPTSSKTSYTRTGMMSM